MKVDIGYCEAQSLMKKRYGQSYRIASAYVDKLAKGPPIKSEDGEALRRFFTALTGTRLKRLVISARWRTPNWLPFGLRQKWRDVANNITEAQDQELTIKDLSNLVTAKARAATHAIFGNLSNGVSVQPRKYKGEGKPRPFQLIWDQVKEKLM